MELNPDQQLREISDRLVRLQREVGALLGGRPQIGASDYGCCSDKGCCQDKGCCGDKKSLDPFYNDLVQLSEKLGVSVGDLVSRIEKLDPGLLKGHG